MATEIKLPEDSNEFKRALDYNSFVAIGKDGTIIKDPDIRYMHNMETRSFQDLYQNFNRFYSIFSDTELTNLRSYVFITRPSMNLVNPGVPTQISNENRLDPFLNFMNKDHNIVLRCLTDTLSYDHDFIPFLLGRTESMQISDYTISTSSTIQPFTNYQIPYPGVAQESLTGGTFDITFREDSELRILKLFQTWIYYMDGVAKNRLQPNKTSINNKEFDYMCSVYQIVCKPDGKTILYFSKHTGAFPTNVPHSTLSFNLHGTTDNKITIPFSFAFQEHMKPEILVDFNKNSSSKSYASIPTYNPNIGMLGESIVGAPYIERRSNKYELKWRPRRNV